MKKSQQKTKNGGEPTASSGKRESPKSGHRKSNQSSKKGPLFDGSRYDRDLSEYYSKEQ